MKSAYELAMERLAQSDPDVKVLSDQQKEALQEIDVRFNAKIAEREIFLQQQLQSALQQGNQEEVNQLEVQLRNERARLEEERESEKERIRNSG